jgi:hypothetical protein
MRDSARSGLRVACLGSVPWKRLKNALPFAPGARFNLNFALCILTFELYPYQFLFITAFA